MEIYFKKRVAGWLGKVPPALLLIATLVTLVGGWRFSTTHKSKIEHSPEVAELGRGFQLRLQEKLDELQVVLEEEIAATDDAMLNYGLERSLRRSRQMLVDRLIALRSLTIFRADEHGEFKVVVNAQTDDEIRPPPSVSSADSMPQTLAVSHRMARASTTIIEGGAGWLEGEANFLSRWRRWNTTTSRQHLLSVYTFDRSRMEQLLDDHVASWLADESLSLRQDKIGFEIRNARTGSILVVWNPNSARVADSTLKASSPIAAWKLDIWMPTETVVERSPTKVAFTLLFGGLLLASTVWSYVHRIRSRRNESNRVSFLTRISHDLRTPITNLRLSVDMAEDDLKDEEILAAVSRFDQMRNDLRQLGGLLDNAIDYSRGVRCPNLVETNPQRLVREAVASFRPLCAIQRMELETRGIENLPSKAKLHSDVVTRIMSNLIDNARKYAADGCWVGIEFSSTSDTIQITISDRGPGLEPAVFQDPPWESSLTAASGGGLGLKISKELAEVVGGTIKLEETETGTTFQITLPMYPSESA